MTVRLVIDLTRSLNFINLSLFSISTLLERNELMLTFIEETPNRTNKLNKAT